MDRLIEDKEKVRSIVDLNFIMEEGEIPPLISHDFGGGVVEGYALRRLAENSIVDVSMTEWVECIDAYKKANEPEEMQL